MKQFVFVFCGFLFASGLTLSGMTDPNLVLAFLSIGRFWDPSLIWVMVGALSVFIPGYWLIIKPRKKALNGDPMPKPNTRDVDANLVTGAVLFGVGWGMAGICPGPALANVASGSLEVWVFILTMALGMILPAKLKQHGC